jgi:hypothetical protein
LVISFIFAFTGVYIKYAIVSQQLIVPKLEDLVLGYGSLKMGAINCQQKYLTLIFFCLFAGWGEHHGKQGWFQAGEDVCGRSRKVVRFECAKWASNLAGIHMKKYSYTCMFLCIM